MTVRIDELVTEMAEAPSAQRGAETQAAVSASPADDLDRLEFEVERRKHRLARLWAD